MLNPQHSSDSAAKSTPNVLSQPSSRDQARPFETKKARAFWEAFLEKPDTNSSQEQSDSVTIVTFLNDVDEPRYKENLNSFKCYAGRHRYKILAFGDDGSYFAHPPQSSRLQNERLRKCHQKVSDFFLRKQCFVLETLNELPDGEILAVLDADSYIINQTYPIAPFAKGAVTHYERFQSGEIMAGNYLLRNSPFARWYLTEWVSFDPFLSRGGIPNRDNGALMALLAEVVQASRGNEGDSEPCWGALQQATTTSPSSNRWAGYDEAIASCKKLIYQDSRRDHPGARTLLEGKIVIIDRGNAFAVDANLFFVGDSPTPSHGRVVGPSTFILHGIKDAEKLGDYFTIPNLGSINSEGASNPESHYFPISGCHYHPITFKDGVLIPEAEMQAMVLRRDRFWDRRGIGDEVINPECGTLCFRMHMPEWAKPSAQMLTEPEFALLRVPMILPTSGEPVANRSDIDLKELFDEADHIAAAHSTEGEKWHVNMGHVGQVPEEVDFMQRYIAKLFSGRDAHICEIGFNAGHSALVWLTASPRITYTAFDIGTLPWSSASAAFLKRTFPARFKFVLGEAGPGPALKDYAARIKQEGGHAKFDAYSDSAPPCDLLSVDAMHTFDAVLADITNGYAITKELGYVFVDDVNEKSAVLEAWSKATSTVVKQLECSPQFRRIGIPKRFCIGQYLTEGQAHMTPLVSVVLFGSLSLGPMYYLLKGYILV